MIPFLLVQPERLKHGEFSYTLLDVGQGLASVIRTSDHILVYDTGPKSFSGYDAGRSIVSPYLDFENVKSIDTVVVSHEHNDHLGGFSSLLDRYPIKTVLSGAADKVQRAIQCEQGQSWIWDGVTFTVLWPMQMEAAPGVSHGNNASCVIRVSSRFGSVLLTGDIEKSVEQKLFHSYGDILNSSVLQVPHQGSKTSSSTRFIETVKPQLALVSAGYLNRFGHPYPSVVNRYKQWGVELLNTAHHGAIEVTFSQTMKVTAARDKLWGYWYNKPSKFE